MDKSHKICLLCSVKRDKVYFSKNKSKKDGLDIYCKECIQWKNKKNLKPRNILMPKNAKNKICLDCKEEKSKDQFSRNKNEADGLYYYCKNCVSSSNKTKIWYINQSKSPYKKEWMKNKYKNDPLFKLINNIRCRINSALRVKNIRKDNKINDYLGCSVEHLRTYIENQFLEGMEWGNHGAVWEIDHIIPCSSFDLSILINQIKCFNYLNLQPLFKTTNIALMLGYNNQIGNRNKYNKE